jgi:hypothetical protein
LIRSNIAAYRVLFGGGVVLNVARLGDELKGVVSFHGTLIGAPANKNLLKAKILVCHGMADQLVKPEEVEKFRSKWILLGLIIPLNSTRMPRMLLLILLPTLMLKNLRCR